MISITNITINVVFKPSLTETADIINIGKTYLLLR